MMKNPSLTPKEGDKGEREELKQERESSKTADINQPH